MKKIIQIFLFFLLAIISYFVYINYFQLNNVFKNSNNVNQDLPLSENQNNLIKNLKYSVNFDNNTSYSIAAEQSELVYIDGIEIVNMFNVIAKFKDQENNELIIKSDEANYNDSNYNTKFNNNVEIQYLNNKISASSLDLNFEENIVRIFDNVVYDGLQGVMKTDNVVIDLITKKTKIFMNNSEDKVKASSK